MYSWTIEPRLRDGELSAYIWMMLALWAAIFFGDDTFKMRLVEQASFAGIALALARIRVDSLCWEKVWPPIGVFRACFLVIRGWPTSQNRTKWQRIWDKCQPQHRLSPSKDFGNQTTIWGTSLTTSLTGLGFQKSNKRVPVKGLRREKGMSRKYSIY